LSAARALSRRACSAALVAASTLATASCDRVTYYSMTGGPEPDDGAPTSGPGGGGGDGSVTRRMVLESVGVCASTMYAEAAAASAALASLTEAHAGNPSDDSLAAVREGWKAAIGAWQQVEVLKLGPAGPVTTPGGQGLRDTVYSWPLVSRCLVEQTLVSEAYADPSFAEDALLNVRGLAAAEYLLFFEPAENACGAAATINTSGAWAALAGAELDARKRGYAAVVSADVATIVQGIATAWAPEGGDLAGTLAAAGGSGSPFKSDQAALNVVSDGLFYIEREVKDMKLGRPLGKVDCAEAACPAAVESQYARVGRDHVKNNLVGFKRVFDGCGEASARGFDDLLRSLGSADVASDMLSGLDGAIAAADALETSDLVTSLASERDKVEALHAAVKKVTDLLKTDFVTILDLEPPVIVEGDND
jgi:predicted lipoprotein